MILVTGGAGLIGSALLRHLSANPDYALAVVDELGCDQRVFNLAGLNLAAFFSPADLLARLRARRALPRFQAVVHLGACSSTLETDASYLMRNNFDFSRTLALWCLERGVRFVYASSAATYGDGSAGYGDDLALLPQLLPRNPYAFSKHAFDLWALHAGAFSGPGAITGLKYFNVYGPGEAHKGPMRSMVLKACEQIQATGSVRLFKSHRPDFADGEQRRDFLYVNDAAALTAWFLQHPEAVGIFNLGSGQARSWNDLARAVFQALGRDPRIEYIEMPAEMRAAYQYDTCADLTRLRAAGCHFRAMTLEEGVNDYVRNHLYAPARSSPDAPRPTPLPPPS